MGRAQISGGGADGRYTISLDIGEGFRTGRASSATARVVAATSNVATATGYFDAATATSDAQRAKTRDALNAYVAVSSGPTPDPALVKAALETWKTQFKELTRLQLLTEQMRAQLESVKATLTAAQADLAHWQSLTLTELRQVWCADFTENGAGPVKTIEINGESDLILLAPGAPAPTGGEGRLISRALMSPEQAYWNAAALPGWQKFKPTFRAATITALDYENDTAAVTISAARSSAQRLDINQSSVLTSVPVQYMTCNADAFEVGDNVVVMFEGQNWESPKVIGFVSYPKECKPFPPYIYVPVTVAQTEHGTSGTRARITQVFYSGDCGVFYAASFSPSAAVLGNANISMEIEAAVQPDPVTYPDLVVNGVTPQNVLSHDFNWDGTPTATVSGSLGTYYDFTMTDAVGGFAVYATTWEFIQTTLPYGLGFPSCVPTGYHTGALFNGQDVHPVPTPAPGFSTFNLINPINIVNYLTGLGALPIVSVTYAGKTRDYEIEGADSMGSGFRLNYKLVPLA